MTNIPQKLHGEGRDGIAKIYSTSWAIEHGMNPDRLEKALELIEGVYQNGELHGPTEGRTLAHFAAQAPDVHLLGALHMFNSPLDNADEDNITPAYLLALRMPTEEEAGKKAAKFLHATGVRFTQTNRNGGKVPVKALEEWPDFWTQWRGWKEMNESPEATYRISTLQLFLAFLSHRAAVRRSKRFLYDLG